MQSIKSTTDGGPDEETGEDRTPRVVLGTVILFFVSCEGIDVKLEAIGIGAGIETGAGGGDHRFRSPMGVIERVEKTGIVVGEGRVDFRPFKSITFGRTMSSDAACRSFASESTSISIELILNEPFAELRVEFKEECNEFRGESNPFKEESNSFEEFCFARILRLLAIRLA